MPVSGYALEKPPLDVSYSLAFEQLQAMAALGLTPDQYAALPGTPDWIEGTGAALSKCDVLAWYRLSGRVSAVINAAVAKKGKHK